MIRFLGRVTARYLICVGIIVHAVPIAAAYWALGHYNVTPRQLVMKGLERTDISAPWLESLLTPPPRYADRTFDGRLRDQHPRILLPQLAGWRGGQVSPYMARRLALYRAVGIDKPRARARCGSRAGVVLAVCWIMTAELQTSNWQRATWSPTRRTLNWPRKNWT